MKPSTSTKSGSWCKNTLLNEDFQWVIRGIKTSQVQTEDDEKSVTLVEENCLRHTIAIIPRDARRAS